MKDEVAILEVEQREYEILVERLKDVPGAERMLKDLAESHAHIAALRSFDARTADITAEVERINEIGQAVHGAWVMLHVHGDIDTETMSLAYTSDGDWDEIVKGLTPLAMRHYLAVNREKLEDFDFWDHEKFDPNAEYETHTLPNGKECLVKKKSYEPKDLPAARE